MSDPEVLIRKAHSLARLFPPWLHDDLVGDALLAAVKGRQMIWAMQDTCRQHAISRKDRQPREVQLSTIHDPPLNTEKSLVNSLDVDIMLARCTPRQRSVLKLGLAGYGVAEAANIMGVPERSVHEQRQTAYSRIRRRFALAAALVIMAAGLHAQTPTIAIDAGAPTENVCTGLRWTKASDPAMGLQPAPFDSLRYGAAIACEIPAPNGTCRVTLNLLENRPAVATPAIPAAGPGLRVFTINTNGISSGSLDLYALAGAQAPYVLSLAGVPVTAGRLRITLIASKGNASVAGFQADCAPTPPPVSLWRCDGATSGASDCTGEYFIQVKAADGSVLKLIGTPADPAFAITLQWTAVVVQ